MPSDTPDDDLGAAIDLLSKADPKALVDAIILGCTAGKFADQNNLEMTYMDEEVIVFRLPKKSAPSNP